METELEGSSRLAYSNAGVGRVEPRASLPVSLHRHAVSLRLGLLLRQDLLDEWNPGTKRIRRIDRLAHTTATFDYLVELIPIRDGTLLERFLGVSDLVKQEPERRLLDRLAPELVQ